jgi:8-oxo-dGTP diphosphatase
MSEMMDQEQYEMGLAKTFIVCGVVIEKDGKYLLVQEKQPKAYGKWNLPAGKVDLGETLEQAAIREAKEECGYDVELERHLLTLHQAVDRPVMHSYKASITGGELLFPEDEILGATWFTPEEIQKLTLRNSEFILGSIAASRL